MTLHESKQLPIVGWEVMPINLTPPVENQKVDEKKEQYCIHWDEMMGTGGDDV